MLRASISVLALLVCCVINLGLGADPPVLRVLRTYDISFLTKPVPQFPSRVWPSAGSFLVETDDGSTAPIAFTVEEDAGEVAPSGRRISAASVVRLIKNNIVEDSWANERNKIDATGSELVVMQTPEVHAAILRLLGRLQAQRANMVTIEVALVPLDALPGGVRAEPSARHDLSLEAVLTKAGGGATRLALTAYNEQAVSGFTGKRRATMVDSELNSTGVIPVLNPVVEMLPIGVAVEAEPRVVAETDWVQLRLRVARLREAGKAEKKETFFADLELVPLAEESLTTTLLLHPGRTKLAGVFRAELGGRTAQFAALARVRPVEVRGSTEPARKVNAASFYLRAYDVAFLLENSPSRRGAYSGAVLKKLIERTVDTEAWRDDRAGVAFDPSGLLLATARPATHRKLRRWLDEQIQQRGKTCSVELRVLRGDFAALRAAIAQGEESSYLTEVELRRLLDETAVEEVYRSHQFGLCGSRLRARGGTARSFIVDVELVSGGTGFAIQEMPDPVTRTAGDGFDVETEVNETLQPGLVRLYVDLRRVETRFDHGARFLAPAALAAVPSGPPVVLPADGEKKKAAGAVAPGLSVNLPFDVELPSQTRLACSTSVVIPRDRLTVLQLRQSSENSAELVLARVNVLDGEVK